MLPFFLLLGGGEDRVSIPLATYSLPELGRLLSTPGEKVEVAGALSERGALVGLRDRSVSEALRIVCDGLDLQVSQTRKGHLELEPNSKIELRDRRWREALLANLSRRAEVQIETATKLADIDHDELLARKREYRSRYPFEGDVISQSLSLASGDPSIKAAALLASNTPSEMKDVLIEEGTVTDGIPIELPPDLASAAQTKLSSASRIIAPYIVHRSFERDPGQLRLSTVILATTSSGGLIALPDPFAAVSIGRQSIERDGTRRLFHELVRSFPDFRVAGIGPDATTWLQATENSTKEELSRPHLGDAFELPIYDPSVSGLVQKWAGDSDQEVVMELAPKAESLNFTPYTILPKPPRLSLTDLVLEDDSWCLDGADGVLVVRNRMAFLDRRIPAPVGAIAHFARVSPGRSGIEANLDQLEDGDPPLPLADALLALVRLREEPADPRFWFDWSGYHGLSDGYLLSRAILLWPGIPDQALSQVESASDGKLSIPVGRFSDASIEELVASMLGRDALPSQQNETYRQVVGATAEIEWKRMSGQEILVRVDLIGLTDETLETGNAAIFRILGKRPQGSR